MVEPLSGGQGPVKWPMQQQWADYRVFLKVTARSSTGVMPESRARLSQALAHFVREGPSPRPLPEEESTKERRIHQVVPARER